MLWHPEQLHLYLPGLGIDEEKFSILYTKILQSRKRFFSSIGTRYHPDVARLVLTSTGYVVQIYNGW